MPQVIFSYKEMLRHKKAIFRKYGDLFSLKTINPHATIKKLYNGGNVLDFGCGNKQMKRILNVPDDKYFSIDIDTEFKPTYGHYMDIDVKYRYDFITANQVMEHIPYDEVINILYFLSGFLIKGGYFFISVPNPAHPVRFLSDPTHITPINYLFLPALLMCCDLKITHLARWNKKLIKTNPNFRKNMQNIYRMDWCDTIWCVGQKP